MQVNLTWTDNSSGETEQRIYAGDTFGNATQLLATVPADAESATVTIPDELVNNPVYLTVTAVNATEETTPASYHVACPAAGNPDFLNMTNVIKEFLGDADAERPQLASATLGSLPVADDYVMGQSARVGITKDGKLYNLCYGRELRVFDSTDMSFVEVPATDASLRNTASQTAAVQGTDGKCYTKGQRSAQIEVIAFDATGFEVVTKLSEEDSTHFAGMTTVTQDAFGHIHFLLQGGNNVYAAIVDPVAKTYTMHTLDCSAAPLASIFRAFGLDNGLVVFCGPGSGYGNMTFWSYSTAVAGATMGLKHYADIVGTKTSPRDAISFGNKIVIPMDLNSLQYQLSMVDFSAATPVVTQVLSSDFGVNDNAVGFALMPWGELAISIVSTGTGSGLVLFDPATGHSRKVMSNVGTVDPHWHLARVNGELLQFNDSSSFIRYKFTKPADIHIDPKLSNVAYANGLPTGKM